MEKRLAPRLRKTILLSVVVAISMTSGIGSEINIQGFGALSVFAQNQVSYVSPNLPGQWQLQWSDEFNGSSLSSDWQVGYTNGWLKDVDQGDVSASNVNVSDGLLHLGVSGDVSSFKVSAIGSTTNYSLGYFEARMKMVSGNGHWPIFWLTQGISNEEADVVEYLGNAPNSYYATFHIGEREVGQVHYSDGDLSANYHVYGLYLGPTDQRFYFDGQEIYRMARTDFTNPMHISLAHSIMCNGIIWDGNKCDASTFPSSDVLVDWVRVWSLVSQPTQTPTMTPIMVATNSPTPTTQADHPLLPGLIWEAEQGEISAPFTALNGIVSQNVLTGNPADGGRALYRFSIQDGGDYEVKAIVNAADTNSNSFFVGMDTEPDTSMIWDVALTNGFEERIVSWRDGSDPNANPSAKVFNLTPGEHTLIVRGREINTLLDKIEVAKISSTYPTPTPVESLIPASPTPVPPSATPPVVEPPNQPTVETVYDDTDSAFVYSGWYNMVKRDAYGGSLRQTTEYSSVATLNFTGESFSILYKSGPRYGILNVYIDGTWVGYIDQKESPQAYQRRWDYPGQLSPGSHTLTLVFASPGAIGSLDAVFVRSTESSAPVSNTPIVTPIPPTATATLPPVSASPTPIPPSSTPSATEPPSQPSVETVYDDADSAFVYSGWYNVFKSDAYGGSYKQTTEYNSVTTLNFTGETFSILYKSGPRYGVLHVYIDGTMVGYIDQNESPPTYQRRWDYPGQLSSGSHTLKLIFVSPGAIGSIDAVIVR